MDKDRITSIAARGEQIKTNCANNVPPSQRQNNVPPFTPGFAWNSTTQEFIEILPQAILIIGKMQRWSAPRSAGGTQGHQDDRHAQ